MIKHLFVLVVILIVNTSALCQSDAQDSTEMAGFARFLYDQNLFDFAAQEYERLSYIYPQEKTHLIYLLRSYRQLNQYDKIEKKGQLLPLENEEILKEYLLSLAMNDQIDIATLIYKDKKNVLNPTLASHLDLDFSVLKQDWKEAESKYTHYGFKEEKYYSIIKEGLALKHKNPLTAGVLSGIIPGAGRVYAKDSKDGIISFIFIASTAYQSYRRFSSGGIKSAGGWIYGGLSLGFYLGNIYGSVKSAKLFNKNLKNKMYAKGKSYIDMYYGH